MDADGFEEQVSITVPDSDITDLDSDGESSEFCSSDRFRGFAANGMVRLEGGGRECGVVRKIFLDGMGVAGEGIDVVAVHKNSFSGDSGKARAEGFRLFFQAVAEKRGGGGANAKYGWYGGSWDEIFDVIRFGFSRCEDFEQGVSHGVGVCLSPAKFSMDSALKSREDENGVRHMLLCRVILGNTEAIPAGSKQLYPSSTDFDSGVDDPQAPRKFIIWSAYMNSHILPTYIISFKAPSLIGLGGTLNCAKKPNSPRVRCSMLINTLSRFLNPSRIRLVSKCYSDFQEQKIDRSELIKRLRKLVGDEMIISAVKLCRVEMQRCN